MSSPECSNPLKICLFFSFQAYIAQPLTPGRRLPLPSLTPASKVIDKWTIGTTSTPSTMDRVSRTPRIALLYIAQHWKHRVSCTVPVPGTDTGMYCTRIPWCIKSIYQVPGKVVKYQINVPGINTWYSTTVLGYCTTVLYISMVLYSTSQKPGFQILWPMMGQDIIL